PSSPTLREQVREAGRGRVLDPDALVGRQLAARDGAVHHAHDDRRVAERRKDLVPAGVLDRPPRAARVEGALLVARRLAAEARGAEALVAPAVEHEPPAEVELGRAHAHVLEVGDAGAAEGAPDHVAGARVAPGDAEPLVLRDPAPEPREPLLEDRV